MLIGELEAKTGISARAIRHYEKLGLVRAERAENGYRHYSVEAIHYVDSIQQLLRTGMSLATIRTIFNSLMDDNCRLHVPSVRKTVQREADRIQTKILELKRSHRLLQMALAKGDLKPHHGSKPILSKSKGVTSQ